MLIEFSVENYRSIREATTLSLVAGRGRELPQTCADCPSEKNLRLLKCIAIYGANASGKSNLLGALRCMVDFVLRPANGGDSKRAPRAIPFRLDPACASKPSRFEIIFVVEATRYVYGFSALAQSIHQEWLHAYPSGRRRIVFERSAEAASSAAIRFGPSWSAEARAAARSIAPARLLLSSADAIGHPLLTTAAAWFREGIRCIGAFPDFTGELNITAELARIDPEARRRFVDFLHLADLGIIDFRIGPVPAGDGAPSPRDAITLIHEARSTEGKTAEITLDSFEEESSGTQKFFALAGPWFQALSRGTLLVIDELDLRLHPLLTRRLIELFYDPQSNPRCGQLVFTTHDSSLLNPELFRRDQIWFAEKTPDGATSLYSLADFRPQKGENFRVGYLEGRYGAIPFVGDLPE